MIQKKPATQFDICLIQDLARRSWEDAYADILSKEQLEYMLEKMYSEHEIIFHLQNPNYHYFIILDDEEPLGFVGFEHHVEFNTTKLHRIYLVPEAKGKGAGKFGLNLVKEHTQSVGDNRIILTVNKNNVARQFYESQNYKVYGEAVFDIGNGYVMDDYLMEFNL